MVLYTFIKASNQPPHLLKTEKNVPRHPAANQSDTVNAMYKTKRKKQQEYTPYTNTKFIQVVLRLLQLHFPRSNKDLCYVLNYIALHTLQRQKCVKRIDACSVNFTNITHRYEQISIILKNADLNIDQKYDTLPASWFSFGIFGVSTVVLGLVFSSLLFQFETCLKNNILVFIQCGIFGRWYLWKTED